MQRTDGAALPIWSTEELTDSSRKEPILLSIEVVCQCDYMRSGDDRRCLNHLIAIRFRISDHKVVRRSLQQKRGAASCVCKHPECGHIGSRYGTNALDYKIIRT